MNGNIKVGKVSMSALIKKNIIRLDVSVGVGEGGPNLVERRELQRAQRTDA
jgi:hypothetical protein